MAGYTDYINKNIAELPDLLRNAAKNASIVQENTLFDILSISKDCEFGRKYDFSNIHTIEEYQKKVPVLEYADFKPYIDRIYNGESNLLFSPEIVSFVFSSGTTGDAKIFPESVIGDSLKKTINAMRGAEYSRIFKGLLTQDAETFAIVNTSSYGCNSKGIPVGTASGFATKQSKRRYVMPGEFYAMGELSEPIRNYIYALFGLSNRNVQRIAGNNLAHFAKIWEVVNSSAEDLIRDIRMGTISISITEEEKAILNSKRQANPARAEELEAILKKKGRLEVEDVWPDLAYVICWLSSSVGRIAREYFYLFPEKTRFIHWGYGASEAKFDVPVEDNVPCGIPAVFSVFMEFKDLENEKICLLDETYPDRLYEIIITTYSGLYRYNLHDIVRITTGEDGLKRIEFICKSKDKIIYQGRTLHAWQLTDMIEVYEKQANIRIRLFQGKISEAGLELFVEPVESLDIDSFEMFMREQLEKIQIPLNRVTLYEKGYRNSLYGKVVQGKSVSSTKLPVFIS